MGHWEDLFWEISAKIKKHRLQRKFDAQLEKMRHQDKHKYKDTRALWEYAYNKIRNHSKEK